MTGEPLVLNILGGVKVNYTLKEESLKNSVCMELPLSIFHCTFANMMAALVRLE